MANVNFAQAVDYAFQRLWAIEAIYNGRDVFVWLPTGFGKSICFQAPSNSNLFSAVSFTPVGGRHLLVSGETTLALLAFVLFSDTCCTDLSKANWEDFASSLKFCYKQLIMIKHEWRMSILSAQFVRHHIRFRQYSRVKLAHARVGWYQAQFLGLDTRLG